MITRALLNNKILIIDAKYSLALIFDWQGMTT